METYNLVGILKLVVASKDKYQSDPYLNANNKILP